MSATSGRLSTPEQVEHTASRLSQNLDHEHMSIRSPRASGYRTSDDVRLGGRAGVSMKKLLIGLLILGGVIAAIAVIKRRSGSGVDEWDSFAADDMYAQASTTTARATDARRTPPRRPPTLQEAATTATKAAKDAAGRPPTRQRTPPPRPRRLPRTPPRRPPTLPRTPEQVDPKEARMSHQAARRAGPAYWISRAMSCSSTASRSRASSSSRWRSSSSSSTRIRRLHCRLGLPGRRGSCSRSVGSSFDRRGRAGLGLRCFDALRHVHVRAPRAGALAWSIGSTGRSRPSGTRRCGSRPPERRRARVS